MSQSTMFATNSDGHNKLGCLERDYSVCKTLRCLQITTMICNNLRCLLDFKMALTHSSEPKAFFYKNTSSRRFRKTGPSFESFLLRGAIKLESLVVDTIFDSKNNLLTSNLSLACSKIWILSSVNRGEGESPGFKSLSSSCSVFVLLSKGIGDKQDL